MKTINLEGEEYGEEIVPITTEYVYADHGRKYQTNLGDNSYSDAITGVNGYHYDLTKYMNKVHEYVNCSDQAMAVHLFCRLVGVDTKAKYIDKLGYLKEIELVGGVVMNNPFAGAASGGKTYNTEPVVAATAWKQDSANNGTWDRSYFGYHVIVEYDYNSFTAVFDATCGAQYGNETRAQYLSSNTDTTADTRNFTQQVVSLSTGTIK